MTDIQKGYAARNRANAMLKLRNRNVIMSVPRQMPNQYQAQLRRATPQEVNYVDNPGNTYYNNTTGSVVLVATIAQGASTNQRIGKRAYYKSLLIRGTWQASTGTTVADATCLLIYDKRPTGAMPAITDILTAASSRAFMNDNNTGRFEVIRRWDETFIGNITTPTTGKEARTFDEYIPLKRRPITFESAGTGAIGDIDSGALYFVTVGNLLSPGDAANITVSFRTRFTEQ